MSDSAVSPRMAAARALLDRDYMRPVTLRRIARNIGMPALRLHQEFERRFGEPPRHYPLRRRMEAAQRLIADGHTDEQVASQVGYSRWFAALTSTIGTGSE